MKLENQNIIIISNESWGDVWYSKHYWAFELSKKNKVFFINPPQRWSFKHLFTNGILQEKYSESLHVLNYNNRLPLTRFEFISQLNEYLISKSLKKWFEKDSIKNYIFWSFDPYRLLKPRLLKPKISIYFAADLYGTKREKKLSNNVDYLIGVNRYILNKFNKEDNRKLLINHGINKVYSIDKKNVKNQIILIGTFSDRVDLVLLNRIAQKYSDTKLYLFGPKNLKLQSNIDIFQNITNLKNVKYKGPNNFNTIIPYLLESKVALALYNTDKINNQLNSLKIIQYLSFGLNVVSTYFEDYKEAMDNNLLYMTNSPDKFIDKCGEILISKEDFHLMQKRINYVKQFLYSNLIERIEDFF